ncbi:cell division protein FtsZ [Arcticibacterium luteifluviistationis]|uniref:Cell division protein FtsZ n=1 Tax=Arcticibacterium luteifluviistationis TaxID=1784714 RepID=A0A2Z4GFP7_9BACT|nr:cell division protein FtsZ [Arcticibacterium luteifluviistationis]AWW00071.1 cell division protein FtsZ [Arcticibacterium luteifluviistationis]
MLYPQDYGLDFQSDMPNIITVIGVGGAGGNAVKTLYNMGIKDVNIVAANTDLQVLKNLPKEITRLQLGAELTKGLGAGAIPKVGEQAALESEDSIHQLFNEPTEMVFITAGMGGGTGTGAAPVIARIAQEKNMLTVGVVTDPFSWEGTEKIEQALEGIEKMKTYCDTVLIVKNDRLESLFHDMDIQEAFEKADGILANGVKSIAELITRPGIINLDYADVKTVLKNAGQAVMGSAEASGVDRAKIAVEEALKSPLLHSNNIKGSKRLLVSICYSDEKPEYKIKMSDQKMIMRFIENEIKTKAKIVKHGYSIDRSLEDRIRVTIVAAGITDFTITPESNKEIENESESNQERSPFETFGMPGISSQKSKNKKAAPENQVGLFEAEEKLRESVTGFTKDNNLKQDIENTPAYLRFGLELVEVDDIPEENRLINKI